MAKQIMFDKDIEFIEINISYDNEAKTLIKERGFNSVPQIYDDANNHIGGYTDLAKIYSKDDGIY